MTGSLIAGNNTYCYIFRSDVNIFTFSGNNHITLWRSNLNRLASAGSVTSMIPSSPYDQVSMDTADARIAQSTVSNPASAIEVRVQSIRVVTLLKSTIKGYSCKLLVIGSLELYDFLDLGANGQIVFDSIHITSPGRIDPFNATITAGTVQIGNGLLGSGNLVLNGQLISNHPCPMSNTCSCQASTTTTSNTKPTVQWTR
ncbi:hypothetical protein SAMD00019534_029830 [Acytostelium subglobosum LB1]|uniref:hypothetical protein n=1 Tax=Acytostelium subglobosum LB1 TaxID=1410327 RepID=UPI000644CCF4|nr:hypothetical protein SAMD00019534_029830 [Acytostelium subglobosum LB1]GAM19808.1 hypothetical protein SAMD00019534_029830 [Acytostelium subglobosum LB1]|eukprot:XP_012756570.1 hypothetical protein SAMD00019534_029830 [Acytostelium subglobosum LB1]